MSADANEDSALQLSPTKSPQSPLKLEYSKANDKKAFVTQDIKSPNNLLKGPKEVHKKLNDLVDRLENNMTKIVECHEKDFLTAYNTQMYQIKKELQELKEKTSKEKMRAKNETKIKMLEKERDWFRDEALKLDKASNEYKQMLEKMKATLEVVEEDRNFFQDQLFNAKKFNKALNMELQKVSAKTIEPSEQPPSSENSFREEYEMNKMLLSEKPRAVTNIPEDYKDRLNKLTLENAQLKKKEIMYKETIQTLQKQEKFRKRLPDTTGTQMYDNNELKEFFLSCIEEVKKDIIKRRALSSNYSSKKYYHNKILKVVTVNS